jgi:hypothetical protein
MSGDHNMNQTDSGWRKRQIALDKKAENARELGLDYEPNKTVIEMAREAWVKAGEGWAVTDWFDDRAKAFEAFAELVRADERNSWPAEMEAMERQVNILTDALAQERERLKWDVHSCGPTCKRYACVAVREAVQAEREAISDEWHSSVYSDLEHGVKCLNEQAAKDWLKNYPEIAKFGAWLEARGQA